MIGRPLQSSGVGFTSQRVRDRLVERLKAQGIRNPNVLRAIGSVPRHLFVDEVLASRAYEDSALPIGFGQTISQPWVVARMTELILDADVAPKRVMEIGTGSGYQAAILAALGIEVHTVERIGDLLRTARKRFRSLGIALRSKHDDGHIGWAEEGPFDAIMVTAGAEAIVEGLIDQLAPGGTLVAPVGGGATQALVRIRKQMDGSLDIKEMEPVLFVPLLPGVVDR